MMYVLPTLDMAKRTSKQRIAPMIEEMPILKERVKNARSRDSGNTQLVKEFPNGVLIIAGANSATGLRSMPARFLFLDEVVVQMCVSDCISDGQNVLTQAI